MITIPQANAENFLIGLAQTLNDVQDLKEIVNTLIDSKNTELDRFRDETITKFNALIDSTSSLKEKIDIAGTYEKYLEERIKNGNLASEVALLETQLQKEKAEISLFIREVTNKIDNCVIGIGNKIDELQSADDIIKKSIAEFKEETEKVSSSYTESADQKLAEISKQLLANSKNEYEILKGQADGMIKAYTEKCQVHLETVKKQSIDFLKQCELENKKLIESVPSVKDKKFNKKDFIVYSLALTSFVCMLAQLFIK
ncbi:hypothetical protein [Treponema sp. Marseille-Q4523]|uniref:hypothetical protein n=1 Tax=Treponema sp. Marseille-Q4523 TaxID=2810610 RepID=UPI0019616E6C|nr:hypothetical protein [Treponema sp. Marseille-Q4523]MBM7022655.1 hypothetical protein [Treponema sp. Marseille-Q4523]